MRFRLIKPDWGKSKIHKKPNPRFVRDIKGPNTYEGDDTDFTPEFLKEKNELGYNIYFMPNSPTEPKAVGFWTSGKDVDHFGYVYVDMDLKDEVYATKDEFLEKLNKFKLKPSHAVDSGNGVHAYWKVSDLEDDAETFIALQILLIKHFDTDDSVKTVWQVMRMPGYFNTKQADNFKMAAYAKDFGPSKREYTTEALGDALPRLTSEDEEYIQTHIDKIEGRFQAPDLGALFDPNELPERFIKDLEKKQKMADIFYNPITTHGDRSGADSALANLLFYYDYDRSDAIQVLMQTQKALTKNGQARYDYAIGTINHSWSTVRGSKAVKSLAQKRRLGITSRIGDLVNGPYFMDTDALHKNWRKKQVLGLIAGTGVGKTAITLKIFQEFIRNNPDSDDIFFYFNLEMNDAEIMERWETLVGGNTEYYERLFVISPEDFMDEEKDMGPNIQNIYQIVRDTCKERGKKPGVVCIDHLDAVEGDFDLTVKPSFDAGKSNYVHKYVNEKKVLLTKDGICQVLKKLSQKLDCFLIVQSQTTKAKDGEGDIPIGKNAAFGSSKFEWYSDYIIGVWRPLNRLRDQCKVHNFFVTAFQYAKIRHSTANKDKITELQRVLLRFLPDKEDFVDMTDSDMAQFDELNSKAIALREVEDKKQVKKYGKAPMKRLRPKMRVIKGGKDET